MGSTSNSSSRSAEITGRDRNKREKRKKSLKVPFSIDSILVDRKLVVVSHRLLLRGGPYLLQKDEFSTGFNNLAKLC